MRRAIAGMKPDRFEDIIALVALYRPGPMENIPVYNAVKHGEQEPDCLHPLLEPILMETNGIIVYQEQVMQIAQVLSGYSLGEADLFAAGDGQKNCFGNGSPKGPLCRRGRGTRHRQGPGRHDLRSCGQVRQLRFQQVPRGGLCAGLLSYSLAEGEPSGRVHGSLYDARSGQYRQARRFPPGSTADGDRGRAAFYQTGLRSISMLQRARLVYAMGAIKGVGEQAVEHIVEVRGDKPFKSLGDFARRISPKALNKRTLENLVAAGAFDELEANRARAFEGLDRIIGLAQRTEENRTLGQDELFGGNDSEEPLQLDDVGMWDQ